MTSGAGYSTAPSQGGPFQQLLFVGLDPAVAFIERAYTHLPALRRRAACVKTEAMKPSPDKGRSE